MEENLIPLCNAHNVIFHQGKNWRQVAVMIRNALRPEELTYIVKVKGWAWVDRRYPKTEGGDFDALR